MMYSKTIFTPEYGFSWLEKDVEINATGFSDISSDVVINARKHNYDYEVLDDNGVFVIAVYDPETETKITHRFKGGCNYD